MIADLLAIPEKVRHRFRVLLKDAIPSPIGATPKDMMKNPLVDIGKDMFEAGQAYVALSRVKAFSGLYVSELDFSRFLLDTDVVAFYAQFEKPI